MKPDKQQLNLLVALFLCAYVPSVYAADVMLGPLNIPMKDYGAVVLMGTWGSAAAMLQKFSKGRDVNWKVTAVSDVVNANLAAMLMFLTCKHFEMPAAPTAIAYSLAGYGGARTLEWAYKRWIGAGDALLDKKIGKLPDTPPEQ
jgi:hypothetical protein